MKHLPAALILEKNKLAADSAWLVLCVITLPGVDPIRLAANNEDVGFQGHIYTAFPLELSPMDSNAQGEIPTVKLQVSNVTRTLQGYIEEFAGGVGATVSLTVVNSAHLGEDFSELEMTFDVLSAEADATWLSLTLGAPNPLRRRYPVNRAIARHCAWQYRSAECGYTGAIETCRRTLDDCRIHLNSPRFGGRPGLDGDVRLA